MKFFSTSWLGDLISEILDFTFLLLRIGKQLAFLIFLFIVLSYTLLSLSHFSHHKVHSCQWKWNCDVIHFKTSPSDTLVKTVANIYIIVLKLFQWSVFCFSITKERWHIYFSVQRDVEKALEYVFKARDNCVWGTLKPLPLGFDTSTWSKFTEPALRLVLVFDINKYFDLFAVLRHDFRGLPFSDSILLTWQHQCLSCDKRLSFCIVIL